MRMGISQKNSSRTLGLSRRNDCLIHNRTNHALDAFGLSGQLDALGIDGRNAESEQPQQKHRHATEYHPNGQLLDQNRADAQDSIGNQQGAGLCLITRAFRP